MSKKIVKIEDIDLEYRHTQVRSGVDNELVEQYAQVWIDNGSGDTFRFDSNGPITLFTAGGRYIVAAGWHRIFGAIKAGRKSIPCVVVSGTPNDALWFALADNLTHGKQLTKSDKTKMVQMAVRAFPDKLNGTIAKQIGVSINTVALQKENVINERRAEQKKKALPPKPPKKPSTPKYCGVKLPPNTPAPVVEVAAEMSEQMAAEQVEVLDVKIKALWGQLTRAIDERLDMYDKRTGSARKWHRALVARLSDAFDVYTEWRKDS